MDYTEFSNIVIQSIYSSIGNAAIAAAPFVLAGIGICAFNAALNKIADFFTGKIN